MACIPINELIQSNYNVAAAAAFHAGCVLAQDSTTGLARPFNRGNSASAPSGVGDTYNLFIGIAADDTARTGNTMIKADPVGSTYLDGSGNFVSNTNAFYVGAKRALGDYQAEDINGVTNLTAGATGFEGPKRGVGVFNTPSTELITDQFAAFQTATTNGTYLDSALSGSFSPGDVLTPGSGVNAGLLVRRTASTDGPDVAHVKAYDSTAGLLTIVLH